MKAEIIKIIVRNLMGIILWIILLIYAFKDVSTPVFIILLLLIIETQLQSIVMSLDSIRDKEILKILDI